jgi:hypothetical protein
MSDMTQRDQAEQWLKAFEAAIDNDNRSRAIELDDINQESQIDWDLMPPSMSKKYDALVERYINLIQYA